MEYQKELQQIIDQANSNGDYVLSSILCTVLASIIENSLSELSDLTIIHTKNRLKYLDKITPSSN